MKILLFIFLHSIIIAQHYSEIEGIVKDSVSGESLMGVNVILLNTKLGAATDLNGYFKIENVPFRTYILECRYITYSNIIDTIELNASQPKIKTDYCLKYIGIPQIEYEKYLVVKGYYISSFEYSGIVPCDSLKPFWVEGNEEFYNKYYELMKEMKIDTLPGGPKYNPTKVYCILNGSISKKGNYGHMGGCEYQFKVKEIIEMKKPSDYDCQNL